MTSPNQPGYDPTVNDWASQYDTAENPLKHGIDETVTGGAFASVRWGAWHKLGVTMPAGTTAPQLLKAGGADFPIYQAPIQTRLEVPISPGSPIKIFQYAEDDRRVNICRTHPETGELQILGQASPGYQLWTPYDVLVGFGDAILEYGEPTVSTCGVLDEGRRVFMSFELPADIRPGGLADENVRLWLVVSTSFDQSLPTTARLTPIRAVCANTLRVGARKAISEFKIKRTRNADLNAMQAKTALGLVDPFLDALNAEAEALLKTHVTNMAFETIIANTFGPGEEPSKRAQTVWDEKRTKLMDLFTTADTQANVRNTAWGALQAVTEYCDWETKVKSKPGITDDEIRMWRSVDGEKSVTSPKEQMARVLLELAGAA